MGIIELLLIALGLAMDAFAVSICKGITMKKLKFKNVLIIALFFGGFQGIMPLIGWLVGSQFEQYITPVDHWIAFILLGFLGVKMLIDSFKKEEDECCNDSFSIKELFVLAIATSIDALAVGITFAFLNVNIIGAVSSIAVITFVLAIIGVFIGHKFGDKFKNKAEFIGGIILILMGVKILLEHLEIISF